MTGYLSACKHKPHIMHFLKRLEFTLQYQCDITVWHKEIRFFSAVFSSSKINCTLCSDTTWSESSAHVVLLHFVSDGEFSDSQCACLLRQTLKTYRELKIKKFLLCFLRCLCHSQVSCNILLKLNRTQVQWVCVRSLPLTLFGLTLNIASHYVTRLNGSIRQNWKHFFVSNSTEPRCLKSSRTKPVYFVTSSSLCVSATIRHVFDESVFRFVTLPTPYNFFVVRLSFCSG